MSTPQKRGDGEGNYSQLENGKWRVRILIDGKRRSKNFDTRKQAQAWAAEMLSQADTGQVTADGRDTLFSEVMESYLKASLPNLRDSTRYQYKLYAREYVLPKLGKLKVGDIKPEHIQKLINGLRDAGKKERTVAVTHTVIHQAFEHAIGLRMIAYNPSNPVKVSRRKKKVTGFYDEEQSNRFLMALRGYRYEALFRLAIMTGMRKSELLALRWSDIDWETGRIFVQRQLRLKFWLYRGTKQGYFEEPKTDAGVRTVKVLKGSLDVLAEHYASQQEEKAQRRAKGLEWEENDLLFTTDSGKPINQRNIYRSFTEFLKRSDLPPIRFHDLRHTCASIMLKHHIPANEVSTVLGHSKPSITTDIYGHVMPGYEDRAAEVMERALESVPVDIEVD